MNRRTFFKSSAAVLVLPPTLASLTGCDTSWINTAVADIPVIVQIADSLVAVAATASGNAAVTPAAIAAVNVGAAAAKAALTTLQQLITAYSAQKTPTTLSTIDVTLTTIEGNLNGILTAFHVDDANLQTAITSGVALALSTIAAIQLLVPAASTATARRMAAAQVLKTKIVILTPEQIKSQFNAVIVLNGYEANQIS